MQNLIYDFFCRGEKSPIINSNDIYFTWKLKGCFVQNHYVLKIFNENQIIKTIEKETNEQSSFIEVAALNNFKEYRCELTVTVNNFTAAAAMSFKTGLVNGFDFTAQWISDGRIIKDKNENDSRALYLKKEISISIIPKYAYASICGLGLYEIYINGQKVGDKVLEPAFTKYNKRILYTSYEVLSYLKKGNNIIEIVLGNGWYNQTSHDVWNYWLTYYRDYPKCLFQLNYDDKMIVSDNSWYFSYGKIVSSNIRLGETHDFTACNSYNKAKIVPAPEGRLCPANLSSIRECEQLSPENVIKGDNCTIYDFGKNISGYCSLALSGKRGDIISIEYSERIKDGKPDNSFNSVYIKDVGDNFQVDRCILSGNIDNFKPHFVYHGFRYAAVKGNADIISTKAYFVHTDLHCIAKFNCSSEILNKLYSMSMTAILGNFVGFPTDCPHREKNGWTGDAQLSLEACLYNFDMQEAYLKWIDDIIDTQTNRGQISYIVPNAGEGAMGCWPAWDIAFYRLPYALWRFYGNTIILKKVYPYLKKHYNFVNDNFKENKLIPYGLGDLWYPQNIKIEICPQELTDSLNYINMGEILADMAQTEDPDNVEFYKINIHEMKSAVKEKYADEKSLTGMAALAYFNIIDKTNDIIDYLLKNNYAMHCGILGAKYLLDVIGKAGRTDILLALLERTEYPSFGYWVVNGQTSLCENFEMTHSLNHHFFSFITEYIIKYFCGIKFDEGMHSVILDPQIPESLSFIEYSINTKYGPFKMSVKQENNKQVISFSVDNNCTVCFNGKIYESGSYSIVK